MPKRGKKYREVAGKVDRMRLYSPQEAIELVKKVSYANFDATVEAHLRMGVDPRHADQQIRGTVVLPRGLGKEVRILVFATGDDARLAQEAGADYVGAEDLAQKIQEGWLDFDVAFSTPEMMRVVGRLGRILGPRGLMPSPKAGTLVPGEDLPRVIEEARKGRVEFRVDRTANIHAPIGRVSFPTEYLLENLAALIQAIKRARPASVKGQYIRRVTLAPTMGPGVRVDPVAAQALEVL